MSDCGRSGRDDSAGCVIGGMQVADSKPKHDKRLVWRGVGCWLLADDDGCGSVREQLPARSPCQSCSLLKPWALPSLIPKGDLARFQPTSCSFGLPHVSLSSSCLVIAFQHLPYDHECSSSFSRHQCPRLFQPLCFLVAFLAIRPYPGRRAPIW